MKVVEVSVKELKPYENNPRNNDEAVEILAKSIKDFGFKNPIVIDREKIIICGHTRLKAAKLLGLEKIPCVMADDLTPEQIKAFRLADNKISELSSWDFEKLEVEIGALSDLSVDMSAFAFDMNVLKDTEQKLNAGKELAAENFADDKFNCECPKCGFKFNV